MKTFWQNYWGSIVLGVLILIFNSIFDWDYSGVEISIFVILTWIVLNQIEIMKLNPKQKKKSSKKKK